MAQSFKETAHLKTDMKVYGENYDRIFAKKEESETVETCGDNECSKCNGEDDLKSLSPQCPSE